MGGNVAAWDIQAQPVEEFETLAGTFGVKALYKQTDVTKQGDIMSAMEKTTKEFHSIDGCIPAAGIAIDKPFIDQTWDEFNGTQEINVSIIPLPDKTIILIELLVTNRSEEFFSSLKLLQSSCLSKRKEVASCLSHRSPLTSRCRGTEWQRITRPKAQY
jgi:NAD(P)-dependent dehydrogenase (short-subunit alcohol dehydrogenase family)